MQDVDNLAWKLAAVYHGEADARLLDTYNEERKHGADENILNSSRTTDFMTPKTAIAKLFRESVLDLVEHTNAMRPLVNSGRLSLPCVYDGSSLNGPDDNRMPVRTRVGSTLVDAPVNGGWLMDQVGNYFIVLAVNCEIQIEGLQVLRLDADPMVTERYLGDLLQAVYLIRPDQIIAARWEIASAADVISALQVAKGG
jgi:3-(3-hydroxy-phenyl)propionate hydroxylase